MKYIEDTELENKKEILLLELKRIASFRLLPQEYEDLDVCVFSMGKVGKFAFQGLDWYFGNKLKYVCDSDISQFTSKKYKGRDVITMDKLVEIKDKCAVIVTSEKYGEEISNKLFSRAIKNIWVINGDPVSKLMDICYAKYAVKMLPKVWPLFSDAISKKILLERLTKMFFMVGLPIHSYQSTPQCLRPALLTPQNPPMNAYYDPDHYFPSDIIKLSDDECFVDGGAYIGDTIDSFIDKTGNKFKKYFAFEIDIDNYNKCKEKFKNDPRIIPYNFGISNENKKMIMNLDAIPTEYRLVSGKAAGREVNVVSVDELLKDEQVTFIKMDVEGEEMNALEGCVNTIKNQKPKLAISAYHKASDIFDVPMWINGVCPEYKLFLRHHDARTNILNETVCYAVK